jgi:dTDP-4-dehydrorhamnose reductase
MEKVDASVFTQPARRPLKTGFIIDKAEKELGYSPIGFMEGIRKMFPLL